MNIADAMLQRLRVAGAAAALVELRGSDAESTSAAVLLELTRLAQAGLRRIDVAIGDRVVLLGANSPQWVAADLAIIAGGAVTVPLYSRQEAPELVGIIADCDPRLVLCGDAALRDALQAAGVATPLLLLTDLVSSVASDPSELEVVDRQASDLATIVYTSGTSGEAKGVMLTHGNIAAMLSVTVDALAALRAAPAGQERAFHYLPFNFAGSRITLWSCLQRGVPLWLSTDLSQLAQEIQGAQPHYFLNVPMLLERIKRGVEGHIATLSRPLRWLYAGACAAAARRHLDAGRWYDRMVMCVAKWSMFGAIRRRFGGNLRCLICGSAPLQAETQAWFQMLGIPVFQVYGLTETTGIVSMDPTDKMPRPGQVGRAVAGCDIKLGDQDELLVRGPHVFPGYWRREAATAAMFADGWLKTGDQAQIDADGHLRVLGRVKNIVVLSSGHNIAPEPIEERLQQLAPSITQAVVLGHGRPFLIAIIAGVSSEAEAERAVAQVNAELPHYRRIRAVHCTRTTFGTHNGLWTANQKLRRGAVEAHFAGVIDSLYAANASGRPLANAETPISVVIS